MTSTTLTISLHSDTATATLMRDTDNRWRWYDTTDEDENGVDMEISGDTAVEAMEALVATQGASSIDGDLSEHMDAARALDVTTAPEWAATIIAEEGMDAATVGPVACLVVTDDGRLADDNASEPAHLYSPDAFRAQVQRWRRDVSP